ncbi:ecdysone oxidase-like [Leguminivora glycinivorella]|uniref:ecdysone oxidase-like n=1 Tax=Leguminivora glycinivorella TaxID=1035111 RepID=UPI002010097A|nr:ecdysone oxidase-like [Leguminivora glycinivorella]
MDLLADVVSTAKAITPNLTISSAAKILQLLAATTTYVGESWPESSKVNHDDHFNFIIVGGGTAGCVLANRLTEVRDWRVLVIESGGDPPLFSEIPGLFFLGTHSPHDWDYYFEDDGVTSQSQISHRVAHTRGKMLGGSSCLDHLNYERGSKIDFDSWPEGWHWDDVLKYFKKAENMLDKKITQGPTSQYHCDKGPLSVRRHSVNEEFQKIEDDLLQAYEELGIKTMYDPNVPNPNGNSKLYFKTTEKTSRRASAALEYLLPIKNRPNFYLLKHASVTKILINENKQTTGVRVDDVEFDVFADHEVVVTAGVFNTPKLLMLSGIGPAEHLNDFDIQVVADLPVGLNLFDHAVVPVVTSHKLALAANVEEKILALTDLGTFPPPIVSGRVSINETLKDLLHLSIYYDGSSPIFLYTVGVNYNYNLALSTSWILNNPIRDMLLSIVILGKPKSRGRVELRSADPQDPPKIFTGFLSHPEDLTRFTEAVKYFYTIKDTSYFKNAGGSFSRPSLPECDHLEFAGDDY